MSFMSLIQKSRDIFLPIKSIAGVNVNCHIHSHQNVHGNDELLLMIRSEWNGEFLFSKQARSQEELDTLLETILPNLKYCKLTHSLGTKDTETDSLEVVQKIPKCDNVKLSFEECSVCLENCQTKTKCSHALCAVCESKIKDPICPLCRACYEDDE